jgi:hypothetical protein
MELSRIGRTLTVTLPNQPEPLSYVQLGFKVEKLNFEDHFQNLHVHLQMSIFGPKTPLFKASRNYYDQLVAELCRQSQLLWRPTPDVVVS